MSKDTQCLNLSYDTPYWTDLGVDAYELTVFTELTDLHWTDRPSILIDLRRSEYTTEDPTLLRFRPQSTLSTGLVSIYSRIKEIEEGNFKKNKTNKHTKKQNKQTNYRMTILGKKVK